MKIAVVRSFSLRSHTFTYPLRVFAAELRDLDIHPKFYYIPDVEKVTDCDVVFLVGGDIEQYFQDKTHLLATLDRYRERTKAVVWCDCSDSTSFPPNPDVLQHVDIYAKCQVLKDRQAYTSQVYYGVRCYTDYYHNTLGLNDNNEQFSTPVSHQDVAKLRLSWNIGLGDLNVWRRLGKVSKAIRFLWPVTKYQFRLSPPHIPERKIDVVYRGSSHHAMATVGYQRSETTRQLTELKQQSDYTVICGGKVPYHQYIDEMRQSKVVISPYGFGEICFRDYECFLTGAVLFKANMDHLETWPNFYLTDQTYVAHAWDFSDFTDKLRMILASPVQSQRIAEAGQDNFAQITHRDFGTQFAQRVYTLIQNAIQSRLNFAQH